MAFPGLGLRGKKKIRVGVMSSRCARGASAWLELKNSIPDMNEQTMRAHGGRGGEREAGLGEAALGVRQASFIFASSSSTLVSHSPSSAYQKRFALKIIPHPPLSAQVETHLRRSPPFPSR